MALPKAEPGKSDAEIQAAAEERMAILGGDPSADKVIDDDTELDPDDLEEVDEDAEDDSDDDNEEAADNDDDDSDDDESTPEDDEEEDADTDEEDDTDEDAQEADDSGDEDPQLTDAYYRAAIHSGYDEKEIVEFMKADPQLAIKTFAKMHDQMNSVSTEFANIGRYNKEQALKATPNEPKDKPGFKKIDLEQLRTDDPDNPLIDVMEQMQEQSEAMFNELGKRPAEGTSQLATDQQKLEDDKAAVIGEKIDAFFKAPGMESYASTYGKVSKGAKDWSDLMPSEKMNRVAVCEQVQELISGAKALGKDMDVEDALDRAHLLITQPIREKMIRKDIMDKVKKRSKSITLKPNSKVSPKAPKKAKTTKDVIANAEERLAAVKW
jgi:hypothetical protein